MRIKSDTILASMLLVLGIIIFVGGISYTFDIIVNPPRVNANTFGIGGAIAICVGSAPLIYGIVTLRDNITYVKPKEEK
jgi:hypothetical protein